MTVLDSWVLQERRYIPAHAGWKESIFTVANGYLSTRGAFEERRTGEVRATFINGLFVTPPGELPLLGAVPDWTHLELRVDGEPFDLDRLPPAGYERSLDLRSGVLSRTVLWRGAETGVVRLRFRRLVSMAEPHLAALELEATALTDPVTLEIATGLDATVPSPSVPVWEPGELAQLSASGLLARYRSIDGAHRLEAECVVYGLPEPRFVADPHTPRWSATLRLDPGRSAVVTKYVTYQADRDPGSRPAPPGPEVTFDQVAASSSRAWAARWRSSTVTVGGDPGAEQALRFAAFHLIGAASPSDPGAAIGARLMSGYGYRHHVFWDTDIFIVPYFNVAQPDLARSHLAYRYRGLEGARRKARRYGREGAFYAWESADTGDEVTPEWSSPLHGPPVRIWTGELEEHITADVAWAADHYWRWTGDDDFLATEGAEMTIEGARYWASRIALEPDGGHIRDVIGPDEYHIHVDDSFFTNLLAAWQLRRAADVLEWLAKEHQERSTQLTAQLRLPADTPSRFRELAERLVLLQRDDGVWEQHAGFFDLEPLDLARFEPRLRAMYDLLGEERLQTTQVIKQPDVLMAVALLPELTGGPAVHRANWDYYAHRADHGSSLSLAFHALVAAQMGEVDLAYDLFRRAADIDLEDSMGNGNHGIHAACQGGLLQTALFGFGGLHLEEERPVTRPRLPDHWTELSFSYFHRGRLHDVELTR